MGLRDLIVNARDTQLVPVPVPEWGCTVYVRELNVGDRLALFDAITANEGKKLPTIFSVIWCVCDENGEPVFTLDDYDVVARKNHDVIVRLGRTAAEVNKLLAGAIDEQKKS